MIEEIIKEIYSTDSRNYKNETNFDRKKVGDPVYGEITKNGTHSLVNHFKKYFNENTVFYDLGSGIGKMVLHIGLQYKVKKSAGIEFSKERHNGAITLKTQYAPHNHSIHFYNTSFLEHDISDATVIYCDNTAMKEEISTSLYNKIPKGCLFLFKRLFPAVDGTSYFDNYLPHLVDRTYGQKDLRWVVKE